MRLLASLILWFALTLVCGTGLVLSGMYLYLNPQIPDAAQFKNVKFKAPLRIYSADNKLIQEFGERLTPVTFEKIPPLFIKALLDTEDKRYFEHGGVDIITLATPAGNLSATKDRFVPVHPQSQCNWSRTFPGKPRSDLHESLRRCY